jgi:tetratricopeptide (TPR) repeat protein
MFHLSTRAVHAFAAAVLTLSPALAFAGEALHGNASKVTDTGGCSSDCTLAKGQQRINQGRYEEAIAVFTCVIADDPLTVDAYRGRSEAKLLLGRYSDAFRDYALLIAAVQPEDIDDLADDLLASYDQRLAGQHPDVATLTGASFARWVFWQYPDAIPVLDQLLGLDPNNVYANLFRGSSRLFAGMSADAGEADLDHAIQLAPQSAHVRFVVADAYTYALPDPDRALLEATLALEGGLDTPRVHAILAAALEDEGDVSGAALHIQRHIDLVTAEKVSTAPLGAGGAMTLGLEPGRTYEIPIQASAGQAIGIATGSPSSQIWDSILVLLGPDGEPVAGSDDEVDYFAGLDFVAPVSGTYTMRVTSFEGISTGPLVVTRD